MIWNNRDLIHIANCAVVVGFTRVFLTDHPVGFDAVCQYTILALHLVGILNYCGFDKKIPDAARDFLLKSHGVIMCYHAVTLNILLLTYWSLTNTVLNAQLWYLRGLIFGMMYRHYFLKGKGLI